MFYKELSKVYHHVFPAKGKLNFLTTHFKPASHLLDMGCSDARVALGLVELGHTVEAADLSEDMVKVADAVSENGTLFPVRLANMLDTAIDYPKEHFDGVYCIGNTLVHLLDKADIKRTLEGFKQVLKHDGTLILQILNYEKILSDKPDSLPLIDNEHVTFQRRYEYENDRIDFITTLHVKSDAEVYTAKTQLNPLTKADLESLLKDIGFSQLEWFSGYDAKPYHKDELPLLVVAKK
ncbi:MULTISPECIES: bifunctional 2-polyprenyl-6-hydroxyphenol methylase/3-demethylubiquinol 3-O-methyltransferase UbiG [unclassified Fusibacter]|uniref:class I SAM-dependent methyltransferase n=1 Tax=unclassified Fusibacter TaxID=2624464 RepID=UPI001012B6A5|nr:MULTISPECIES: class I SAM-dependent methyltransferase [unclassified Fusibacter]MCK8060144.1 class I SAM-dependent methyltransferase [Fusibacter sp. A2]NPE22286.1 methyltransferase domain-containing protein [Fusibacter sp. A1]RXV61059.1 methyltransferase domain-containing protein [Fusibacter sp. A1]